MRLLRNFVRALILVPAAGALIAATIRVPSDYPTIQAAINAAAQGDAVSVAPGIYRENINFGGKAITVSSEQGPGATVIDGGGADSVVKFISGEGRASVLSGFTLQNGRSTFNTQGFGDGGGVWISYASPSVLNNLITGNQACSGAGILVRGGSPLISGNNISRNFQSGCSGGVGGGGIAVVSAGAAEIMNNTIEGNTLSSADGGGVSLFAAGNPTISGNVIRNNSASGLSPCAHGGGVSLVNQSDALITNNVIAGNSAGCGGGLYWLVPSSGRGPYAINNTVVANLAGQGPAIYASGYQGASQVVNNIIVSSATTAAVYCDGTYGATAPALVSNDVYAPSGQAGGGICSSVAGSNGNISSDPVFVDPAADFHLQTGSPAVDSGSSTLAPMTDIEGTSRPLDGNGDGVAAFDMGAYEAKPLDRTPPVTTASSSPQPAPADWNNTPVTVTLTATDDAGSVRQIQYSLSGGQTGGPVVASGATVSFQISAQGITTVSYFATDASGNVESVKTYVVAIDLAKPVISGMPAAGCTLSPVKHQMIQVAHVTASDSLSGVGSLNVTASSNQPDSGTGGGDVPGDILISGGDVYLRAERSPGAGPRVYTVQAVAADAAGNLAKSSASCTVK